MTELETPLAMQSESNVEKAEACTKELEDVNMDSIINLYSDFLQKANKLGYIFEFKCCQVTWKLKLLKFIFTDLQHVEKETWGGKGNIS